jgi:alpha-tubulin suppressor-like RCC1 family protein
MPTNYTFVNSSLTGTSTPVALDDYFIPKAPFTQGNLFAWGSNTYGQLGDNTTAAKSSPVQTIDTGTNWKQVSATFGEQSSFGIKTDGTLWAWGINTNRGLGIGTNVNQSSPVQIGTATTWKQVSGDRAIKTDGTLWVWGFDGNGIGVPNISGVSTPVQVGTETNWKQVSRGYTHSLAVKTDGTLWSWGRNLYGELGDGTFSNWNGGAGPGSPGTQSKSTPVQVVGGGTNWKKVSAGFVHTAAIKTDGTLWHWGEIATYQISTPVQVVGGGTNWKEVFSGNQIIFAIKTDGTLWYINNSISSPVQVVWGGTNWKQVSTGYPSTTTAIKSDGTLWSWGSNTFGQLGLGDTTYRSTPVQLGIDTNWKQVSTSGAHAFAIKVY